MVEWWHEPRGYIVATLPGEGLRQKWAVPIRFLWALHYVTLLRYVTLLATMRQPKCGRRRRLRRAPLRPVEAAWLERSNTPRKRVSRRPPISSFGQRSRGTSPSRARRDGGEGTLAPVPSAPPLSASPPPAPSLLAPPSSPPPRGAQSGRSGGRFSARREERTSAAAAAMRWLTRSSSPAGQTRRDS